MCKGFFEYGNVRRFYFKFLLNLDKKIPGCCHSGISYVFQEPHVSNLAIFLNKTQALCPPNPKVFDIATETSLSCGFPKVKLMR
jgi:hypothetical protein